MGLFFRLTSMHRTLYSIEKRVYELKETLERIEQGPPKIQVNGTAGQDTSADRRQLADAIRSILLEQKEEAEKRLDGIRLSEKPEPMDVRKMLEEQFGQLNELANKCAKDRDVKGAVSAIREMRSLADFLLPLPDPVVETHVIGSQTGKT